VWLRGGWQFALNPLGGAGRRRECGPVSLGGIDEVRLDCSARLIPWPNMDSWIGLDTHGHNSHPVALLHLQESPAIPTKT